MKNLILTLIIVIAANILFAQTPPQGINYQAVIADDSGAELVGVDLTGLPLANRVIRIRFTIIKNTPNGPITYREYHSTATDDNGLISVIIGQGIQDDSPMEFSEIQWGTGNHYLKVEIDINGGLTYKHMSTTQFWSVPYALYAKYAEQSITPMYLNQSDLPIGNFAPGMIAFVRNCIRDGVPCMVIWDGTQWINVDGDSDPTNELGLQTVANDAARDLLFPTPQTGDMVWNEATGQIQVYNGTNWVSFVSGNGIGSGATIYQHTGLLPLTGNIVGDIASVVNCDSYGNPCVMVWTGTQWFKTVDYIAYNGLTKTGQIIELGGSLIHATSINTTATNTLAITGLQQGSLETNNLLTINPTTGVLTQTPTSDFTKEYQITYLASAGQTQFITPIPISDINKVNVYRNGIRIGHVLVNLNTIQLESGIVCVNNDQIRIVQFR